MKNIKNQLVLFLILIFFWMLWNNNLKFDRWISGIIFSVVIIALFAKKITVFEGVKLTPAGLLWSLYYILVFIWAVIRANVDVFLRVLDPKLPIKPGIVKVETCLKSPIARMILANSITLTPGTFVVDMKDSALYIHWIEVQYIDDPQKLACEISCKFERILMKIYE